MSDQPETLAAILAEMRDERIVRIGGADVTRCLLLNLADRIEAAAKREEDRRRDEVLSLQRTIVKMQDAIARQADAVNAASLRDALEEQLRYWNAHVRTRDEEEMRKRTEAALSAQPRNCDVGTAEEQAERMEVFCTAHKYVGDDGTNWCSRKCPLYGASDCSLAWSQMPFAPAEGGAE